eukprot:CAMPEP_0201945136 /NCGR_PEP_ID=MMETSP0903-20130614/53749_1 /ASSEMBLY_ACC=CAM_ASM_000552 /TAXON_ID=420261 /ORGANISM="Thalassiosira antarctica, Strain CCMP982" /LENGTH=535 /DNA_ID=CAMNT_0048488195 /DNA_START=217 /DNA_END=1824 /DNA_ORIENTATION=-
MVLPDEDEPMWASDERSANNGTSIPIEDQAIAALEASPPLPCRSITVTPDKFVDNRLLGFQNYISTHGRPYSFPARFDFSNGYSPKELKYNSTPVTFARIIGMPAGPSRNRVVRLFIKYFENERLHDSQDMAAAIDPTNGFEHLMNGEAIGWNLFAGRWFVHLSLGHGMSMVLQLRRIVYKAWMAAATPPKPQEPPLSTGLMAKVFEQLVISNTNLVLSHQKADQKIDQMEETNIKQAAFNNEVSAFNKEVFQKNTEQHDELVRVQMDMVQVKANQHEMKAQVENNSGNIICLQRDIQNIKILTDQIPVLQAKAHAQHDELVRVQMDMVQVKANQHEMKAQVENNSGNIICLQRDIQNIKILTDQIPVLQAKAHAASQVMDDHTLRPDGVLNNLSQGNNESVLVTVPPSPRVVFKRRVAYPPTASTSAKRMCSGGDMGAKVGGASPYTSPFSSPAPSFNNSPVKSPMTGFGTPLQHSRSGFASPMTAPRFPSSPMHSSKFSMGSVGNVSTPKKRTAKSRAARSHARKTQRRWKRN